MNPVEEHISTRDLVLPSGGGTAQVREESAGPLLPADFTSELRSHWDHIQAGFVDEPRKAVQDADELVARFKAITDPKQQTAFWRSLTPEQRTLVLNSK